MPTGAGAAVAKCTPSMRGESTRDGGSVLIQADDRQIELHSRDQGIIAGVAALPGKWWGASGAAANTLTPSSWSAGGQPAYNDTYVSVRATQTQP